MKPINQNISYDGETLALSGNATIELENTTEVVFYHIGQQKDNHHLPFYVIMDNVYAQAPIARFSSRDYAEMFVTLLADSA